jgi:hypothetical protein
VIAISETCASSGGRNSNARAYRAKFHNRTNRQPPRCSSATASSLRDLDVQHAFRFLEAKLKQGQ